jgi:dTDP-4-amino-4,6-dideoxygalactose transaminase
LAERIYLSPPHTGAEERRFVEEAFDTNWIAPVGPQIFKFEEELGRYIGRSPAAVLSSGTAALHLALVALGVQSGDEVICQSFTFCGSANPIRYQGAWPVFVDSEPVTWNIDPVILEEAISDRIRRGKRPGAIVYVHLYGMPARVEAIRNIAGRYEIPLIEDAAEALGSRYNGQLTGNFGDWSFFSFNGNKIITTSGGGALLGPTASAVEQVRFLATQARDPAPHYEHSRLGFNYRMSNVCAAIGRGQLIRIEDRVAQRRAVFERYREGLSDLVEFQTEPPECRSNRWLTCILLPDAREAERIRESLESANIECRPLWKPMHRQPLYREAPCYIQGISDGLFARGLCLPSGSDLRPDQQEIIIRTIRNCLNQG